jgi:hypothetical protein
MTMGTVDKPVSRERYLELRKLSEELYEWLKTRKVDYEQGECCVLKELTLELLKRE